MGVEFYLFPVIDQRANILMALPAALAAIQLVYGRGMWRMTDR